jgi:UDP-N-acetylmuramate--alanine ligase
MERKGEARGIAVYDDYGHHPTEIAETLAALRSAAPDKRLVVAFKPHRYTRTRDCLELFAPALAAADVVVLTDIYAAGEAPLPGVAATELLRRLPEGTHYAPRDALAERLLRLLQPNDLLMTLGAGDVTEVGPVVLAGLRDS